jgi:paraquat-inducible protein B
VTSETPDALENTTLFYIDGANAESINEGDAVTFRGLQVGTITRVSLSKAAQGIVIQMNIQNKYLRLIRANTIFWPKVGIEANLGLFGSKIKVNSMESIMSGGLEFRTPDEAGPRAKAGAHYKLSSVPKDYEKWYPALN